MQEKLPVAGPFNTKNAEYGDFEQKTIYSFITYAKIYKYLLIFYKVCKGMNGRIVQHIFVCYIVDRSW